MITLKGVGAAGGLCIGRTLNISKKLMPSAVDVTTPHNELAMFEAARILAKEAIGILVERAMEQDKAIFAFQLALLDDEMLLTDVSNYIEAGAGAVYAVERAASLHAAKLKSIDDDYLAARHIDVLDACYRVVEALSGAPSGFEDIAQPCVILASEIMPSETLRLPRDMVLGIATSEGSSLSHAAIVARTIGIPCVVMAGAELLKCKDGTLVALDGTGGEVIIDPDEATKARFLHRTNQAKRRALSLEALAVKKVITRTGAHIKLLANCNTPKDVSTAIALGAEGVGLLRSEFLFMGESDVGEQRQYEAYKACIEAAQGREVTIRTFDLGADKPDETGAKRTEVNPALGLRGIRLSLRRRASFITQIKALLRAAPHGAMRILFPMISSLDDVDMAMQAVEEAKRELEQEGAKNVVIPPCGIMIETPASALLAAKLAPKVQFFSVGTNDLTQYTLATDRTNSLVESYYKTDSEAVMALIENAAIAAAQAGIEICVCGETAADPRLVQMYVALGIHRFSMVSGAILNLKEQLLEIYC